MIKEKSTKGVNNGNWKGGPHIANCFWCNSKFSVLRCLSEKRKFCSTNCYDLFRSNNKKKKPIKKLEFLGPYSRLSIAKQCGHLTKKNRHLCNKCFRLKHKGKKTVNCGVCQKELSVYEREKSKSKKRYCSRICYAISVSERQKGGKSHLWLGGRTDENRILRNSAQAASWRKAVFKRDSYTCIECGQISGKLTADHIKPWALYPELRFEVTNGRTLCWPCHLRIGVPGGLVSKLVREKHAKNK